MNKDNKPEEIKVYNSTDIWKDLEQTYKNKTFISTEDFKRVLEELWEENIYKDEDTGSHLTHSTMVAIKISNYLDKITKKPKEGQEDGS